jgi:hypothetical protein
MTVLTGYLVFAMMLVHDGPNGREAGSMSDLSHHGRSASANYC